MRAALFLFVLAIAPSASAQSRSWWSAVPGLTFLRVEGTGTFDRDDLDRWLRPRVARVRRCGDPTRGLVVEGSLTLTPDRTSFVVTRPDARVESCVVEELSGPPVEDRVHGRRVRSGTDA